MPRAHGRFRRDNTGESVDGAIAGRRCRATRGQRLRAGFPRGLRARAAGDRRLQPREGPHDVESGRRGACHRPAQAQMRVRRALYTLTCLGLAASDGRTFRLTPKIMELASAYLGSNMVSTVVQPACERLSDKVEQLSLRRRPRRLLTSMIAHRCTAYPGRCWHRIDRPAPSCLQHGGLIVRDPEPAAR